MIPVFVVITIALSILTLVKNILDYKLKRKILDKENIANMEFPSIIEREVNYDKIPFLKWGLIILFAGAGLILIEVFGFSFRTHQSSLPFGIVLMSVAMGFLTYFGIMQSMFNKKE